MEHMSNHTETETTKPVESGKLTRTFAGHYEMTMTCRGAYRCGTNAVAVATIERCEPWSDWEETSYYGKWRVVIETANENDGYSGNATEWAFTTKRDAEQYARSLRWAWGQGFWA